MQTCTPRSRVVLQLMDYIEQILDRKVSSLEVLVDRNNRDVKFLNHLTDRAREDIRLLEVTQGREAGKKAGHHGRLITDDIRFYMQLLGRVNFLY